MSADKIRKVAELKRNNLSASCHNKTLTLCNAANLMVLLIARINKLNTNFYEATHFRIKLFLKSVIKVYLIMICYHNARILSEEEPCNTCGLCHVGTKITLNRKIIVFF